MCIINKIDLKHLIPKDKFDIETAEKLKDYSYEELKTIIPQLMEWIQDMNWPVASVVSDYLTTISEHIQKEIVKTDHLFFTQIVSFLNDSKSISHTFDYLVAVL